MRRALGELPQASVARYNASPARPASTCNTHVVDMSRICQRCTRNSDDVATGCELLPYVGRYPSYQGSTARTSNLTRTNQQWLSMQWPLAAYEYISSHFG